MVSWMLLHCIPSMPVGPCKVNGFLCSR
jgi:hypothetical protein